MIAKINNQQSNQTNGYLESPANMLSDKYCHRCGGLMISENCYDVESHTGEFEILIRKCLSCGETIDPTILKNRFLTKQKLDSDGPELSSDVHPALLTEGTPQEHSPSQQ